MRTLSRIDDDLRAAADRWPERVAVQEPDGAALSYSGLARLTDRWAEQLHYVGVQQGNRVGISMSKSVQAVAAIYSVLKAGACYVPVAPSDPRATAILARCDVKLVITDALDAANANSERRSWACRASPVMATTDDLADTVLQFDGRTISATGGLESRADRACILHTSGSTGTPKGVELSHRNVASFLDWAHRAFDPEEQDCFSSHAPFYFDLSILDLFLPLRSGASVVLIDESLKHRPRELASLIERCPVTSFYSTPTALELLVQYGRLLDRDLRHLRRIAFAGEAISVPTLQLLRQSFPHVRFLNLYGPTETNVCTYYEVPAGNASAPNGST